MTANVGGIVGANGYNSTVKANTIGSADTVVHGGMVDGTYMARAGVRERRGRCYIL